MTPRSIAGAVTASVITVLMTAGEPRRTPDRPTLSTPEIVSLLQG